MALAPMVPKPREAGGRALGDPLCPQVIKDMLLQVQKPGLLPGSTSSDHCPRPRPKPVKGQQMVPWKMVIGQTALYGAT